MPGGGSSIILRNVEFPDIGKVLGLDIAQLAEQARLQAVQSAELQERVASLVGRAETPDGRVRLSFSPGEGLPELHIDPRAMRLGSQELSETIRGLVLEAIRDLDRQRGEAAREVYGEGFDPETAKPDPKAVDTALQGVSDMMESAGNDVIAFMERMRRGTGR